MRIRLISYRDTTISLNIEKKFVCNNPIISIGCDCHPAYVLKSLNLRTRSFPFDWMDTTPSRGIEYVNDNIRNEFRFFLADLIKNKRGHVVSRRFEDAEFFHYPELIQSQDIKNALLRRAKRFLEYLSKNKCYFLFNVTSEGLKDTNSVSIFVDSVNEFFRLVKGNHVLLIYIRYDENLQENESNCNLVEIRLKSTLNARVAKYIRQKSAFGIWGDKRQYTQLLESLGVKLRLGFPKMYFSKTYRKST